MFEFVDKILSLLCRVDTESVPKLLIAGALKLVGLSGIAMGLDYCSSCGKPVPKRRPVLFHPGRGGVICTPCGGGPIRLERDTISALQRLGSCLIEQAASLDVPAAALAGCEIVISDFIEHHLGRPLKTRSVVIQMHSPPLG
jgi:recombinational DNA repair protein (RecF pathway)